MTCKILHTFLSVNLPQLEKTQKMVLNYDAIWWMFWNSFWDFFIVGPNGENFSEAELSKSKNIGF